MSAETMNDTRGTHGEGHGEQGRDGGPAGTRDDRGPDEKKLADLVSRLTLDQKVRVLTGADFWSLHPLPEIGLGRLQLSDGPNGVRGTTWDERDTSLLFPNPSALAATWDPGQAHAAGALMGAQARDKGIAWHLAPNVNLHRSPLGGRHFECYSEDPLLTSVITEAFVHGAQGKGVAVTVKHYVANESETDRMTYDARLSEKTLREVQLQPFEAAARAGAWSVMAAYNAVDGATMTEHRALLTDVLKDGFGWDGAVVSDWFATRSTAESANAGLDLVMPGPQGPWGDALAAAVRAGEVEEALVDDKVLRILRLAARTGHLEGFDAPAPATTPADAEAVLRDLAARAMVVLRNEGGLLPLAPANLRRVALVGPNAAVLTAQGGGSAHVNPAHVVSPLAGLAAAFGAKVRIDHHEGVVTRRLLPQITGDTARDPDTGEPGLRVDFLDAGGRVLGGEHRGASRLVFMGGLPEGTAEIHLRADVVVAEPGTHQFSISGAGLYALKVGDSAAVAVSLAAEGGADPVEALVRPPEHRVEAGLAAGVCPVELRVSVDPSFPIAMFGLHHQPPRPAEDELFAAAVEAARVADLAIVVVGTTDEVETEGFDRRDLRLPGRQDELVRAVAAANPRTVVVVNAGAPVEMPWREEVPAILWAWLPGQEGGAAIADALLGVVEPGGRLPTTFPAVAADAPVLATTPVAGKIDYSEGSLFGYRGYEHAGTRPAYAFGHGLGYTRWRYQDITAAVTASGDVNVQVRVRNVGERAGREIVQIYLGCEADITGHGDPGDPPRLVGFDEVLAAPDEIATATVVIPRRVLARWDAERRGWAIAGGTRKVIAAHAADDPRLTTAVELRGGAV